MNSDQLPSQQQHFYSDPRDPLIKSTFLDLKIESSTLKASASVTIHFSNISLPEFLIRTGFDWSRAGG